MNNILNTTVSNEEFTHFNPSDLKTEKGDKFSLTKIIKVSTDEDSKIASNKLVVFLNRIIEELPNEILTLESIVIAEENINNLKLQKSNIDEFIEPLIKMSEIDVLLDAPDVCYMLDNLKKSSYQIQFILDFLITAIHVAKQKNLLKEIESVTPEDFLQRIAA